jgi:hypothetical protein
MMACLELLDSIENIGIKSAINRYFEALFVQERLQWSDVSGLMPTICGAEIRWASAGRGGIGKGANLSCGCGSSLSEHSSRRQSEERENRDRENGPTKMAGWNRFSALSNDEAGRSSRKPLGTVE